MSSGKSERFAGSRWTTALVLAGMLVLGFGLTAMAQSADAESNPDGKWRDGPEGRWREALVGTWVAQVTVRDCDTGVVLRPPFPAILSFATGGTLTFTTGGQPPSIFTPGLGVWKRRHGHHYSSVSEAFFFTPAGALTSIQRLTRAITVGREGNWYSDVIAQEILDTHGTVTATGCGDTVAHRLK